MTERTRKIADAIAKTDPFAAIEYFQASHIRAILDGGRSLTETEQDIRFKAFEAHTDARLKAQGSSLEEIKIDVV